MSELMEAACDLAASGWAVHPCRESGERAKQPYLRHGKDDASTEPDLIRSWWELWPDALIGAVVPAGVVVLDVDPRHGGDMSTLPDLPETLTCVSGRGDGGVHLYFRHPGGRLSDAKLDGIDLRFSGRHYCIMPPSPHPTTGRPYTWADPAAPIVALPYAVAEMLRPDPMRPVSISSATPTTGQLAGLVRAVRGASVGDRNRVLFWAACRAAEGDMLQTLAPELIAAAQQAGLSVREASGTIRSASKTIGGAA